MSMLHNEVKTYLEKLDQEQKALVSYNGEHDVAKEIKEILAKDTNYKPTDEDIAEQMAFDFMAEYPNDNFGWGTYHGPMFVMPNQQGQMVEYPSIKRVNEETLNYWVKRAKEAKNPILSSRYADLVIDFSPKAINKNADIALFQIVIDSNIAICEKSLADSLDCKTKIKRALVLAIQINNQEKIAKIKETIINLEKRAATDDKPGLWGFAFKWLILDFSKKITIDEKEKTELIKALEDRLKRVEKDTWLAENAVSLLAEYYANEKDEDNLMRVLDVLEKSLKTNDRTNSDALLKVHAYEKIHEIYQKYRDKGFQKAKAASDRISQEMGQLDLDWNKSLKEISVTTKIKQKDIDDFLKAIFGEKEQGKLEVITAKIAIKFLPKKEAVEKQLKDVSGKHPLQFLCTTQIISDDGIPIAKLSTLEEDYDNHFQRYASQYLQFGSFFLTLAIDELKKRISKQNITEYFRNSTLFENENKEYLERALSAYWDNDYLASSHLFNPLIETAIRELVKNCGGIVLKPNNLGGYDRVTLGSFLREDEKGQGGIIKNVFSKIDQNVCFYFRLVLTSSLGMNLRDDFAHGFGKKKFFTRDVSDRLFHVMMCLSLVKKQEEKNK
ncbi:MAG: DUF4209 domain-containing protein [Candidatus Portnoybacteria bacterium]|nr:DUF4209 domain-containing protein [Candidatus Portnoybacteria bacterium]